MQVKKVRTVAAENYVCGVAAAWRVASLLVQVIRTKRQKNESKAVFGFSTLRPCVCATSIREQYATREAGVQDTSLHRYTEVQLRWLRDAP